MFRLAPLLCLFDLHTGYKVAYKDGRGEFTYLDKLLQKVPDFVLKLIRFDLNLINCVFFFNSNIQYIYLLENIFMNINKL